MDFRVEKLFFNKKEKTCRVDIFKINKEKIPSLFSKTNQILSNLIIAFVNALLDIFFYLKIKS